MLIMKILGSVILALVLSSCNSAGMAEPKSVNYMIVRMVARSPTSPVLGYTDSKAREIAKAYAKEILDIHDIPAYEMKREELLVVKRVVADDRDRNKPKTPPYFVVEFGTPQAAGVAYSMGRETLYKIIPLAPSDVRKFLQLMYDSSNP